MPHKIVTTTGMDIDQDLLKQFEDLPDAPSKKTWTPERDSILLAYWNVKRKDDVARLLGVARSTAKIRYDYLTRKGT